MYSAPIPSFSRFSMMLIVSLVMVSQGIAQDTHPYRTPQSIALASALQRDWQATQGNIPLLDLVQQWRLAYSVPVWLDRRIASDRDISIGENWPTILDSLVGAAEQIDAEVAWVDGTAMLVPTGLARHLESAYWSLALDRIPRNWVRQEDLVLSWEDGAVASDVLREFATRFPLADFRPEQIDYDVWRADRWEKTTPLVAAIGLLSGFDLKPVLQQDVVSIEPIRPEAISESVSWEYQDEIAKLGKERWLQWRERWKDVEVRRLDGGAKPAWKILGPISAHRELVRGLAPPPKRLATPDRAKTRYTGRYRGELQMILKSLAKQQELELDWPDLPPSILRQELDLSFEQATFDEILQRIGEASGLQLQLKEKRLVVTVR